MIFVSVHFNVRIAAASLRGFQPRLDSGLSFLTGFELRDLAILDGQHGDWTTDLAFWSH